MTVRALLRRHREFERSACESDLWRLRTTVTVLREVLTIRALSEFLKESFLPFAQTRFKEFPKTEVYYRQGVARLASSQLAGLKLDELTNQHAAQFEAQHGRYSASTINQALRTLRRAMRLAEEWGALVRAPKIALAKRERQRERIVTEEEFNLYIMACRQPWRDAALNVRILILWERPSLLSGTPALDAAPVALSELLAPTAEAFGEPPLTFREQSARNPLR